MDADKALGSDRSKNDSFYLLGAVKTLKNNVNDTFAFPDASTMDSTSSAYHTHRMRSIKSTPYVCSAVERYTNVSAQLKSTFNQISTVSRQQSISSTSSSSSTECTGSSLPSSIVEIIVKSNENLFKSAENLLKSKESQLSSDEESLFKSAEDLLKETDDFLKESGGFLKESGNFLKESGDLLAIQTNHSLLSTHENLFKCLSITDESLELNNLNLASSSSSLDSSSYENIYSLYPIHKRPNSINKSKTSQALNNDEDGRVARRRNQSLSEKSCVDTPSHSNYSNHYLVKETYLKEKDCLTCRVNLIELNLKDRKSLTISIKWPLSRQRQNDKLLSIHIKPVTESRPLNVHIKY